MKEDKKNAPDEFTLSGKTVLEIGTGWHGVDLLIFFCLGVQKIITVDHHRHLTFKSLASSAKALNDENIIEAFHSLCPRSELIENIARLEKIVRQASTLSDVLEELSVAYIIMPSREYKNFTIEANNIDLIYSESVLQRIPERHIRDFFQSIQANLSWDAMSFHRTDQKDINSQDHVDENLWALQYLKYPEWMHWAMQCRFNYQNRLRESDFIELFVESNMPPICIYSYCKKGDVEKLASIKLATKFKGKPLEDIAIRSSIFICRFDMAITSRTEREISRNIQYM